MVQNMAILHLEILENKLRQFEAMLFLFLLRKRLLLRIKTFLSFSEGLIFILNILQFVDFFREKRKLFERKTSVRIYVISILFGLRNRQKFSQIILAAANERKTYFPNPSFLLCSISSPNLKFCSINPKWK